MQPETQKQDCIKVIMIVNLVINVNKFIAWILDLNMQAAVPIYCFLAINF